jgi:hypothetical protein
VKGIAVFIPEPEREKTLCLVLHGQITKPLQRGVVSRTHIVRFKPFLPRVVTYRHAKTAYVHMALRVRVDMSVSQCGRLVDDE